MRQREDEAVRERAIGTATTEGGRRAGPETTGGRLVGELRTTSGGGGDLRSGGHIACNNDCNFERSGDFGFSNSVCAATSSRVQSAGILGLLLSPQRLGKWYLTQRDK